jgi:hypothetical protein
LLYCLHIRRRGQGEGLRMGTTRMGIRAAWISCLAIGAAMAAPQAASAQEAAIEACRATPSDAERIACLEDALREASSGVRIPIPFVGGGGDRPADAAPPAPAASNSPPAESMGAEQVAVREGTFDDDDDDDDNDDAALRMNATIAVLQTDSRGLLVMQLDNGQVWRQTESVGVPILLDMDDPQPVEISTSGFGGYRMQLLGPDRRIIVERVR